MNINKINDLTELPLKVILNDKYLLDLLCTPVDIENLFKGFLFSQGYIDKTSDIKSITFNEKNISVNIVADCKTPQTLPLLSNLCADVLNQNTNFEITQKNNDIDKDYLDLINEKGNYLTNNRTKGLHAALLYYNGVTIFKEDISRHCAIDKAIGESIDLNFDLSKTLLVTTGRISTEFLFKAKMLNIPIIASLKYPSYTGLLVAQDWGINLATHVGSSKATLHIFK